MKISSFSATEENSSKSCNLYEYFVTKQKDGEKRKQWIRNVYKFVKERK